MKRIEDYTNLSEDTVSTFIETAKNFGLSCYKVIHSTHGFYMRNSTENAHNLSKLLIAHPEFATDDGKEWAIKYKP